MQTSSTQPPDDSQRMRRPLAWLLAYLLVSGVLYFIVTHFPIGHVRLVVPTELDVRVPILPATVPLYLSYILIMPTLVWLGRRQSWLLASFFAGTLATGICLLCHLFWPTEVVRPFASAGWLAWLHAIDTSLAASPSGHVALPMAISFVLTSLRQRSALIFLPWSALLILTVLTTGQHLFTDVVFGLTVGVMAGAVTVLLIQWRVDLRSMAMILLEWLCIIITLRLALAIGEWWLYPVAILIVSTRQHALYILYHDSTHYHLSKKRYINDLLTNVAIGIPGLVPIEFYRPLHIEHHRHLGTEQDPERRMLYQEQPWQYKPLNSCDLARQVFGDLFLLNTLRAMRAYKREGGAPIQPTVPLLSALLIWVAIVAILIVQCSVHTLILLATIWFGSLLTLCVLLQKIRSFAEHSGGPGVTAGWDNWTYAWQVGLLGRCFIWPYNINLHLQHHRNPNKAWHALPSEIRNDDPMLSSRELLSLLWQRAPKGRGNEGIR